MHVADRVDMHGQRYKRHNTHHQRRQPIHQEAHFHTQAVGYGPGVDTDVFCRCAAPEHVFKDN